jgi:hypothetical protein|uniref:Uncharacterized protein n=1 Tax=viral metagenome TaxID=1070528 RepID=A0A6C0LG72_9ZZZZ
MCWNAEVSLNSFIFGVISFIITMSMNTIDYKYLLLPLTVSSMQLVEYFAWKNINNKEAMAIISLMGMSLILLQILIINITVLHGKELTLTLTLIITLILLTSLAILTYVINNNKLRMEKGVNGHLVWHWADIPIPLLIIILSFYFVAAFMNNGKFKLIIILAFILLLISLYSYYKYKTWGSMWCYYANFGWIFFIGYSLLNLYKRKIKK